MPPRRAQGSAGVVFHVLNRGVRRLRLFDDAGDYEAFLRTFAEAQRRIPIRCFAYCVMPNHFHFVLRPDRDGQLSQFMFWLGTTHAMRWHAHRGSSGTGSVYQGRFKAIPVCADDHFLRLCRYVERNPLRAGLVTRAERWNWSSLYQRRGNNRDVRLDVWPVTEPTDWLELVNEERPGDSEVRAAICKGTPYGPTDWRATTAKLLRIEPATRPRGRPKTRPGLFLGKEPRPSQ
jgi:putative transposase